MSREEGQPMRKTFIIYPNDICYKIWQNFLVLLALYTIIVSSFVFVFLEEPQARVFKLLDYIVNSFFCIDIALNFSVAYHHKNTFVIVDTPKHIALHYLKTWFILDVMCNIPPMLHAPHVPHAMFLVFQLLWRHTKVLTFLTRLEEDIRFSFVQVRIAKLFWIWLFNMHVGGCIIYFIGTTYGSESIWMRRAIDEHLLKSYVNSIYRFVTVSFVKPVPYLQATPLDMVFIVLFKLVNMGFLIYAIANANNLVALYG